MAEKEETGEALEGQEFVMPAKRKGQTQATGNQEIASQEQPSSDGKTPPDKEQGQPTQKEQGTQEVEPWWRPLGFKSENDAVDSYGNLRAELTRKAQELSQTKEERAYYQGLIDSQKQATKEPEMTEEQWNQLFNENPAEFMRLREERLVNSILQNPTITETVNLTRKSQANLLLSDLRSKHSDFVQYEDDIARELEAMGNDAVLFARTPEALERIYRLVRAEKHAQIVREQEQRLSDANKQVTEGANKFANIGASSMNAAMPGSAGGNEPPQTVRTKVGDLSVDDMEFVINPRSKMLVR